MNERVLVLGGGVGGVVAARTLRSELPSDRQVVLVERSRHHLFQPSLLWMLTGDRDLEKIRRPVDRLEKAGIEVRMAEVEEIEPEAPVIRAGGERLEADTLVIALGAELRPDLVPGLEEAGYSLYSVRGVEAFAGALAGFEGGRHLGRPPRVRGHRPARRLHDLQHLLLRGRGAAPGRRHVGGDGLRGRKPAHGAGRRAGGAGLRGLDASAEGMR